MRTGANAGTVKQGLGYRVASVERFGLAGNLAAGTVVAQSVGITAGLALPRLAPWAVAVVLQWARRAPSNGPRTPSKWTTPALAARAQTCTSGAVHIGRSWSVSGPWNADKRRSSAGADERHIPSSRATLVSAGRQRLSAPARSSTSSKAPSRSNN